MRQTDLEEFTSPPPALPEGTRLMKSRELIVMLAQCHVAKENPRAGSDPRDVEELAANIAAHGQLTSCIAYEEPKGSYQVTAGARRLAALEHNAGSKAASGITPVRIEVLPKPEAIAAGLAEQVGHTNMTPAEEARAFADQIEATTRPVTGGDLSAAVKRIAASFGKTERYVRQRLALSTLHPPIFKAFADGKLTIEQAAAWANAGDLQEEIWSGAKKGATTLTVWRINELVERTGTAETDRLVRYVGLKALQDAGASAQAPLFTFAGDELDDRQKAIARLDSKLVKVAARQKLDAAAAKLKAEGWGFADVTIANVMGHPFKYAEGKPCTTAEQKAKAGCFLSIDRNGKLKIERNLKLKATAAPAKGAAAPVDAKAAEAQRRKSEADRKATSIALAAASYVVGRSLNADVALACILAAMARGVFGTRQLKFAPDAFSLDVGYGSQRSRVRDEATLTFSSDAAWKAITEKWEKRVIARQHDLEVYIFDLQDSARDELLVLLANTQVDHSEYGPPEADSRAQLAMIGRLCNADPAAHATPATAELLASPLVQELTGRTAPAKPEPKPKKPAAKKAKQKEPA